jgi:hypothetical protein
LNMLGYWAHAGQVDSQGGISAPPLQAFLTRIVKLEAAELAQAPTIAQGPEGRTLWAAFDKIYAYGDFTPHQRWRVVRGASPIQDPVTGEVLGHIAQDIGAAQWLSLNASTQLNTLQISQSNREIQVGDLLIPEIHSQPLPLSSMLSAMPSAAPRLSQARVAYLWHDRQMAGSLEIIILNQGTDQGVQVGHPLALWHQPLMKSNAQPNREQNGKALVFHTTDRLAWALPIGTVWPIRKGDEVSAIVKP